METVQSLIAQYGQSTWDVVLRQQVIYGYVMLWSGIGVVLSSVIFGGVSIAKNDDTFNNDWEYGIAASVFALIIGIILAVSGALYLINPQFYAIKTLIPSFN